MANSSNEKANAKPYRIPKKLDILPPRPVLFPWLPSFDDLSCCGGERTKTKRISRFSFDLGGSNTMGTKGSSSSEAGTPITLPLSPNNDDDNDNAIADMPDMSNIDESSPTAAAAKQNNQQQLGSLTDVIAEVLRVIFFLLSMKNAVLRNGGEGDQLLGGSRKK